MATLQDLASGLRSVGFILAQMAAYVANSLPGVTLAHGATKKKPGQRVKANVTWHSDVFIRRDESSESVTQPPQLHFWLLKPEWQSAERAATPSTLTGPVKGSSIRKQRRVAGTHQRRLPDHFEDKSGAADVRAKDALMQNGRGPFPRGSHSLQISRYVTLPKLNRWEEKGAQVRPGRLSFPF